MSIRTYFGKVFRFPSVIAVCPVCSHGFIAHDKQDYCEDCGPKVVKLQMRAIYLVNKAVRKGDLAPPTAFVCEDCAQPAQIYEHRDYGDPLNVVPTCTGCNSKRGHAVGFGLLAEQQRAMRLRQRNSPTETVRSYLTC